MTFWRTFHSVNEDLAFYLGLSLNFLLLALIKKIKIQSMQKYNILLFQCCCIDLIQVFTSFIVKPITIFHHKNVYFLSNGFLRDIGGWIEMLGIVSWATSVFFCICSMPVSYIFRYQILCLGAEISRKFYITSLLLALSSASTFGMIVWKFHYLDNQNLTYLDEFHFPWLIDDGEEKMRAASVCFAGTFGMWFSIVDVVFLTFIPYGIIIIYNIKILTHLKYSKHILSVTCRRVQTDLNRILLAQATIPIFSAFLPMTIQLLSVLIDFDLVFTGFICGILYSWIPVGNAVTVLLFVTAYRKKLKQLVSRLNPRLPQLMSISATVTTIR